MNLSIPDAAAELAVSETRLRRTLLETPIPTLVEFRQTRTGVRKTTVLTPDVIAELRTLFTAPASQAFSAPLPQDQPGTSPPATASGSLLSASESGKHHPLTPSPSHPLTGSPWARRDCAPDAPPSSAAGWHGLSEPAPDWTAEGSPATYPAPSSAQTVPIAQFNALLYQHNVLRQELSRVTEYLDGCDRLLGEMVRTIASLEERTRQLDLTPTAPRRAGNPLSGALRSVSAGVQNALFSRAAKPMPNPPEVYYGSVLAGR